MCPHKPTTNISTFSPRGALGRLFNQAKTYNEINAQLNPMLPDTLKTLQLCLIKESTATLITSNPAVAFRAKQQLNELILLLQSIPLTEKIDCISIKVSNSQ
ncbi:hypothetical protein [Candidatus Thioglobus sp.]|jgi:hypothetical protein|uniref:hypothetical protein n=1 Tax=Candidatus Thioglobus sp. TaxID=2026721 RepID=UPI001D59F942|nr:hypothetical protein [Candidatus Thioglobus sp.]MBT3276453.1 hypothetical protein [Candidatus Thioglobus sp.]MBT3446711.1 hypothetical protein [Candidatus Thioglobus sp.]MBT3745302.1 hypothetical protein [Candidatus Thioglobus sp.]MBT4001006.1 hypothetical protein [Candidatus Thioglobus sp.]MBT4181616.1 hypothetical protein [Candidatus Thioglobus sp.]